MTALSCGVFGAALKRPGRLDGLARAGLESLDHRGRDSHGVAWLGPDGGIARLVREGPARDSDLLDPGTEGSFAIGHTRYGTSSGSSVSFAQPMMFNAKGFEFAISHNGNISNNTEIERALGMERPSGQPDTYTLGQLIKRRLDGSGDIEKAVGEALREAEGSFSMAILFSGKGRQGVLAVRDRFGYMPLYSGENEAGFYIASETVTFLPKFLGIESYSAVVPGEMLLLDGKRRDRDALSNPTPQHCGFQLAYMMRGDSEFEGSNVSQARERAGRILADLYRPDVDTIVPVPESGRPLANGYSGASGIPQTEGILKERGNTSRSFMFPTHEQRTDAIGSKFSIVGAAVDGKRVLLLDDSIVRGNTIRWLVEELRRAGAIEVHVALGFPEIVSQCFYGHDFYNEELVARQFSGNGRVEVAAGVARTVGADSVYYISREGFAKAAGVPLEELCFSCVTGDYAQPVHFETAEVRRGSTGQ
ncbi:MAG: hypothetical protein M1305_03975 [Candidatus Marsarchaeota archaeon]|nr:hypothetical protein [Candidatus Marsarchaeota archaeon]